MNATHRLIGMGLAGILIAGCSPAPQSGQDRSSQAAPAAVEQAPDQSEAGTDDALQSATTSSGAEATATTVYITESGQKYHRAGCRYLAKSSSPISRSDAVAQAYTACNVCKP